MPAWLPILLLATVAQASACAPTCTQIGSGVGGCCDSDFPCFAGLSCDSNGTCQIPTIDPDKECIAGTTRCADDTKLERCATDGRSWEVDVLCVHRCEDGQCVDPPCDQVPARCEGELLYGCIADGGTWGVLERCATGCESTDAGATCAQP